MTSQQHGANTTRAAHDPGPATRRGDTTTPIPNGVPEQGRLRERDEDVSPTAPLPLRSLPLQRGSSMDSQDRQRVAINEATFRKVNEGMQVAQDQSRLLTFICECGRLGCNQLLELSRAEYEGIRANPRRFAIISGHEIPESEKVVEHHDRYLVVEKAANPEARIVERTDPRSQTD